jgi:hypothetical protein
VEFLPGGELDFIAVLRKRLDERDRGRDGTRSRGRNRRSRGVQH